MRLALANPASSLRPADPAVVAFREARLEELARMRAVGIDCAERIGLAFAGRLGALEIAALGGMAALLPRFFRTQRAVRQIVILEMELLGLRPAPDRDRVRDANVAARADRAGETKERPERLERLDGLDGLDDYDDLRDRSDYDTGPYDEVVARVRRELGTAAPANDPFAPPAGRAAPAPKTGRRTAPGRAAAARAQAARAAADRQRLFRPAMSAKIRKIVYGPVVTLRMALIARGDVLPIPHQGLKARYLAGEIGRGRGPPW